jgi:hypothetical protein
VMSSIDEKKFRRIGFLFGYILMDSLRKTLN